MMPHCPSSSQSQHSEEATPSATNAPMQFTSSKNGVKMDNITASFGQFSALTRALEGIQEAENVTLALNSPNPNTTTS